ncbi:MAG: universal stress protein, partial [Pseudomonadota bacterium]
MYRNILVPMALDHGLSADTLQAARLLLDDGGVITALHVYETPSGSVTAYLDENLVRAGFDAAQNRMEEKLADHTGVKAVLKKGHAARTIVD